MVCPKCKNIDWEPIKIDGKTVKNPLKNLGDKVYHKTFVTRRYMCYNCGAAFLTEEKYYRDIEGTGKAKYAQLGLFDGGK